MISSSVPLARLSPEREIEILAAMSAVRDEVEQAVTHAPLK